MKPNLNFKSLGLAVLVMALIFALDQVSKYWVVEHLDLRNIGQMRVNAFINFHMAWNTGINFGLFSGNADTGRWILVVLASVIGAGFLLMSVTSANRLYAISTGVIAGGAFGNVVDRVHYGAVADFLNVSCCGIRNPWSFNVADIAVFIGVFLFLLAQHREEKKTRDKESKG